MLSGTPDEQAAYQALDAQKPIRARELAEKALAADPDAFVATWVLAQIFHREEARHPRARYLIDRALTLLKGRYGAAPTDPAAIWWHKQLLDSKATILGEMEDREGQIATLDAYDALYTPKLTRERIWCLMKLHRLDEATTVAKSLITSSSYDDRVSGYNGLCAIGDFQADRNLSYSWCTRGIEAAQGRSCILYYNAAQAAMMLFRFTEAEELARKALRAENDDCPSSSYYHLTTLYLTQGAFQKAISAFKRLARSPILPRYRPLFSKDRKGKLAEILMELGKIPEALKLAREVFDRPDRPGMTSVKLEEIQFNSGVFLWQALDAKLRMLAEATSVRDFWQDRWKLLTEQAALTAKRWEVSRTLTYLALSDQNLVNAFRPFLRGTRPWAAGALGRIFGVGLARAALAEAERADTPQLGDVGLGYFTAVRGELSFHDGDLDRAVEEGERALTLLAPEHVLLAYRVKTWLASAYLQREGATSARAVALLRDILQRDPTPLREFDIHLPVTITADDNEFTLEIANRLVHSERLQRVDGAPFRVHVAGDRSQVTICIAGSDGFRFGCGEKKFDKPGKSLASDAALAADAFHAQAFSPMIELTSSDINSLDGSAVRATSDQVLEGILKTGVDLNKGEEEE